MTTAGTDEIADQQLVDEHGLTPGEAQSLRRALHELRERQRDPNGLSRLAVELGVNRKQLYRRLPQMPGAEKLDPSKPKSHYFVADPIDSARRWRAGERRGA